jgi:hypothetical protein
MKTSCDITVWMFDRLGLDGALAGDLLEERARGRSSVWYWRQVLVAVLVGIWGSIRNHKVLALRAVATGFAMEYSLLFLWHLWVQHQSIPVDVDGVPVMTIATWAWNLWLVVVTQTATGWVVARTHRAHQIPMVFLFVTCFFLWYFSPGLLWAIRMLVDWDRIDPRIHPMVVYTFVCDFLAAVCVVFGCVLSNAKEQPSTVHPGAS